MQPHVTVTVCVRDGEHWIDDFQIIDQSRYEFGHYCWMMAPLILRLRG